jgi:DNA mismatch repair protein MutS
VAKLAGVPVEIVKRAKEILTGLEEGAAARGIQKTQVRQAEEFENFSFDDINKNEIYDKLKGININVLSPMEAFNVLYELIKLAEK